MRAPLPLLFFLVACDPLPADAPAPETPSATPSPAAEDAEDDPDRSTLANDAPTAAPGIAAADAHSDERVVVRHVLVAYAGALRANGGIHRTKDEARARAEVALSRLNAGEDFNAVAREMSDDSTAPRGGFLGAFRRGAMQKDFEDAAFALPIGGMSGIVETPFGFHILRRDALEEAHLAHILVQWADIPHSRSTRTRDEALVRAQVALARVRAGEPFDKVAREISDGATAPWGGDLGVLERGQMVPAFDEVAFALKPKAVSELVESPLGFHIVERVE